MRYNIGKFSIIATASALIMTGMGSVGVAQAQPVQSTSLYAPSALVLSVGKSEGAAVTVQRAVTLSCALRPSGTSPLAHCGVCGAARGRRGVHPADHAASAKLHA